MSHNMHLGLSVSQTVPLFAYPTVLVPISVSYSSYISLSLSLVLFVSLLSFILLYVQPINEKEAWPK